MGAGAEVTGELDVTGGGVTAGVDGRVGSVAIAGARVAATCIGFMGVASRASSLANAARISRAD